MRIDEISVVNLHQPASTLCPAWRAKNPPDSAHNHQRRPRNLTNVEQLVPHLRTGQIILKQIACRLVSWQQRTIEELMIQLQHQACISSLSISPATA